MRHFSIRVKLINLTLITLIPLTILQAANIHRDFSRSTEQKLQGSVELAQAISSSFLNYIEELWDQELIISKYITTKINDTKNIQTYLEEVF